MSTNMNIDELIDWLKNEGFNQQSTFDKLREEQFNGSIFCCASDDDLAQLDPSLRHGPKIQLRTLRNRLKEITAKNEGGSKPPVSPPAPQPQDKPVAPTPTHQPVEGQSGKDSQEYKAVQSNVSTITKAIRMTPSALDDMRQKFVEKNWLDPSRHPNERELVDSVLYRIERKTSEFRVFIAILCDITGLDLIADKLEGAVPTRTNTPPVTTVVTSTTKPMAHPVYDFGQFGEPNLSSLMNFVGMRVRNKWYAIGGGLGVEATELESIQTEEAGKPDATQHCMRRVFQKWHSAMTSEYTWQKLVRVLESQAVNEKAAVAELYKSLCDPHNN